MPGIKKFKGQIRNWLSLPFLEDDLSNEYYKFQHLLKFPFEEAMPIKENIDPAIEKYFKECENTWRMMEYHYCYKGNAFITSQNQWAITEKKKVIKQSAWSYFEHGILRPDIVSLAKSSKHKRQFDTVISIHTGWMNYWHFYNDILGQLALADKAGLSELPIIIPQGLSEKNYFKELLSFSKNLRDRNWIIHLPKEHIKAKELHFFSAPYAHRKNFDAVLGYIDDEKKDADNEGKGRKLFITRSKKSGRSLANVAAVEKLLTLSGFEIVDCNELTVREQIELFISAEIVIAIHGAALANIIYRRGKPLHVVEIFPEDFFNPCYYWMARQYGFSYSAIKGTKVISKVGVSEFSVEIQRISELLID